MKVRSFIERHYSWSVIALLAAVVIASYWRVVTLYFWVDDWDLFLKVTHPELGLWGMSPGLFGDGPYRYLHTPFMLLYPLFGLEASYYFAVGTVLYFLASVTLYYLLLVVSQSKKIALVSSLFFASMGYVGSYTMTHLSNSYQMVGTLVMTNVSLYALALFYTRKRLVYYGASIILFWATTEFFFIRAHGIVFLFVAFPFIFFLKKNKEFLRNIFLFTIQAIPFIFIFHRMYKQVYHVSQGNATAMNSFISNMSRPEHWSFFLHPFGSFGNALIPDILIARLYTYINTFTAQPYSLTDTLNFVGAVLLCASLLYGVILARKGHAASSRILFFGVFWFFAYYLGYFISSPRDSLLTTIHRYLTTSTPGIAMIAGILVTSMTLKIRRVSFYPVLTYIIIFAYILLSNNNLATISKSFSMPTRRFYEELIRETPQLSSNPVILFDFENDPALKYQIQSSFPATAIALFYEYDTRVPVYHALEDVVKNIDTVSDSLDNLHTFYISHTGIEDTTVLTREILLVAGTPTIVPGRRWKANVPYTTGASAFTVSTFMAKMDREVLGAQPSVIASLNHTTVVPNRVTIRLSVQPLDFPPNAERYMDVSDQVVFVTDEQDLKGLKLSEEYIERKSVFIQDLKTSIREQNSNVSAQFSWKTNQGSIYLTANTATLSLIADSNIHSYEILIPAGGTLLEEVTLHGFDFPVSVSVIDMKVQPLTLDEILKINNAALFSQRRSNY